MNYNNFENQYGLGDLFPAYNVNVADARSFANAQSSLAGYPEC